MKTRSDKLLVLVIVLVLGGVLAGFFVGGHTYKPLTQENFASSISKAATGATSMHMAMASNHLNVSADFNFADPVAMKISLKGNVSGKEQTINMLVAGGSSYVQIPPQKWINLGASASDQTMAQFKELGPQGLATQFQSGVKSVTYAGQATVNGKSARQYTLVVDASSLGSALSSLARAVPAFKNITTVTEQVYLNDQNVLQRWEITLPEPVGTMTIDFTNWNQPVNISAPAASDQESVPVPSPSATPTP